MTTRAFSFSHCLLTAALALSAFACGGGSGVGPDEIKEREDKLKDQLTDNWEAYQTGDFTAALEDFTRTLEQADVAEDLSESVRKELMSEAHNGIGWTFFKSQDLDSADVGFSNATRLNRRNADAWAGWAAVALAKKQYTEASQRASQTLQIEPDYNSQSRFVDEEAMVRPVGHDDFDGRHVRLLLAEAYFQLGRYSAVDGPDPNNAAAQLRLVRNGQFDFTDPGDLLDAISKEAEKLLNPL